jgi:hypothetical protein
MCPKTHAKTNGTAAVARLRRAVSSDECSRLAVGFGTVQDGVNVERAGREFRGLEFRGQTELALCESIKLLRFECEFALTAIRNNLFSGPTLLWGQTPLRYLLQVMDEFRIPQRSARVCALANGGKV